MARWFSCWCILKPYLLTDCFSIEHYYVAGSPIVSDCDTSFAVGVIITGERFATIETIGKRGPGFVSEKHTAKSNSRILN